MFLHRHRWGWGLSGLLWLTAMLPIRAQVSVSPLVIELTAERGQAQSFLNVQNNSTEPFRARVYAEPFTYTSKGFQALAEDEASLVPYLRFSPTELELQPNTERRIRILAQFAPSTPAREFRAVLFTERLDPTTVESQASTTTLVTRIGSTLYVRNGDLSPTLMVKGATWDPEAQTILLEVNNVGNASGRPSVSWILQQDNQEVSRGEHPETTVIAETTRSIPIPLTSGDQSAPDLAQGEYQLQGELLLNERDSKTRIPFSTPVKITTNVTPENSRSVPQFPFTGTP